MSTDLEKNSSRTKVIGLIDDNTDMMLYLEREIVNDGHVQAYLSPTPKFAVNWVINNEIDILACDYNLEQEKTGLDILRECRKLDLNIPLILFSAGSKGKKELKELKTEGANLNITYIDKKTPGGDELISQKILSMLNSSKYDRNEVAISKLNTIVKHDKDIYEDSIASDLIQQLSNLKNKNKLKKIKYLGINESSTEDIIDNIKEKTPKGKKWINLYFSAMRTLAGGKPDKIVRR